MRSTGPPWASLSLLLSQLTVEIRALTQFATPFSHDPRRIFVVSKCNELGVSQLNGTGPLQKLNLCDYLRAHPNTFLHFLRGKPLTPSARGGLGKVREGALGRLQVLNPLKNLASRRRDQAGPHPGCVNEVLPTVEAQHE
jgi:hypothetical protein